MGYSPGQRPPTSAIQEKAHSEPDRPALPRPFSSNNQVFGALRGVPAEGVTEKRTYRFAVRGRLPPFGAATCQSASPVFALWQETTPGDAE